MAPSQTEHAEHTEVHETGHGAHAGHNPFEKSHLIGHVKDSEYIELPRALGGKIAIPQYFKTEVPVAKLRVGFKAIDDRIEPFDLKLTKFMLLELLAALVLVVFFGALAARIRRGVAPRGRITNMLEAMVVYIRDEVARPAIGHHDADRFLPFLLTVFFFVLVLNLFGLVPWFGSATGALATTSGLALFTFGTVLFAGMVKLGPIGYWAAQVPHVEASALLAIPLKFMIFTIEVFGLLVKHFVLAMRLLANMVAGHLVLGVLMAFIAASASSLLLFSGVMPVSVLGAVALSMLELLVAFIQAYVFTFLAALFIGMAVHPH